MTLKPVSELGMQSKGTPQNHKRVYYKKARLDGWDFYTGNTINYRENIGKTVIVPHLDKTMKPELCSPRVLHASWNPNCFIGAKIPCSMFLVSGRPVVKDEEKAGFYRLKIIEEIPQFKFDTLLGWRYSEVVNPIHPLTLQPHKIEREQIDLLKVWDSVRASVGDSVWDSVRDSVGAYIGSLFPNIQTWKYIKHEQDKYPFQSCVDLWKQGLVPSFDGVTWRLHGTEKATILYEVSRKKLLEAVV